MKTLLRSGYLENHDGNSYKFYQPVLWRDGDDYIVEAAYGRIGSAGVAAPKHRGTDPATAFAVYERLVSEKLRGGYQESERHDDRDPFLRERGAGVWDLEPRLAALRGVELIGETDLAAIDPEYRLEALPGEPIYRLAVLVDARGPRPHGVDLTDGRRHLLPGGLRGFLVRVHAAGYAPCLFEVTIDREDVTTLIDVWELNGADLSGHPGAERILLREQLVQTLDVDGDVDLPREGLGDRRPLVGIGLASGRRAWIERAVSA